MTSTPAMTTTKKKTSKALLSAAAGGAGATKRQAIYSEDEDYLITSAYVNVSEDPIWGVGQKADTFWTQVSKRMSSSLKSILPTVVWRFLFFATDFILIPQHQLQQLQHH